MAEEKKEPEKGRKPDYNITAMNMDTRRQGKIGAAWKQADGSISIVLDPFVILQGDGLHFTKVAIRLWPNDGEEGFKKRQEAAKAAKKDEINEDDIPF